MDLATDRKYTVYMHTSPSGKRYIGITCQDVARRWRMGQGYKACSYFWKAIEKHGWDNIFHEVLAEGLTEAEANQREKELIIFYKTHDPLCGYNLTDGGDGVCGWVPSAATRAKIGATSKGRTFTAEAKKKMSEAQKGHVVSAATRATISAAKKGSKYTVGYKRTAEDCAAISARMIGKVVSAETKQKLRDAQNRLVRDVECLTVDGEVIARYISCVAAEEKTGINKSSICQVCLGHRKTAGKFRWRYV